MQLGGRRWYQLPDRESIINKANSVCADPEIKERFIPLLAENGDKIFSPTGFGAALILSLHEFSGNCLISPRAKTAAIVSIFQIIDALVANQDFAIESKSYVRDVLISAGFLTGFSL